MNRLLFAILLLLPLQVQAADLFQRDPWTTADTVRQGIYLGLLAVDCGQSIYGTRFRPTTYEATAFLRESGESVDAMRAICLSTSIFHTLIARQLSAEMRQHWQYISIIIESAIVHVNSQTSIGFNIAF